MKFINLFVTSLSMLFVTISFFSHSMEDFDVADCMHMTASCMICTNPKCDYTTNCCKRHICRKCLVEWIKKQDTMEIKPACPWCRQLLSGRYISNLKQSIDVRDWLIGISDEEIVKVLVKKFKNKHAYVDYKSEDDIPCGVMFAIEKSEIRMGMGNDIIAQPIRVTVNGAIRLLLIEDQVLGIKFENALKDAEAELDKNDPGEVCKACMNCVIF